MPASSPRAGRLVRQYLRPEADVRDRCALNKAQQRALERVAETLAEALAYVDATAQEAAHGSGRLRLSANRLCFLSGARGTGKTTVLYSLLDGIEKLAREPAGNTAQDKDPLTALRADARRIIPLEPLDMEPLTNPANLLAALLARVEQVADYPADEWERSGLDRGPSPSARAFDEFSRVQADAALAWASDLPGRGLRGDPDTLASETRRVEFARLKLAERIDNVLGQLASGMRRATMFPPASSEGAKSIFLLPIDDFDLNPARCLELLRLLRMLMIPGLFTVIAGNADIAETILGLKMWNDLADVAGVNARALVELRDQQRGARMSALAQSLAADAMRKLVPPGQLVRLDAMSVSEALDYRPSGELETLQEKLARFALEMTSSGEAKRRHIATVPLDTAASMLLVKQKTTTRWNSSEYFAYPGAAVLSAPPRRIADAWAQLDRIIARHPATKHHLPIEEFLDFLAHSYARAVREDNTFEPLERDILLDAVRRDFRGCWLLQTDLIMPVHYAPAPELPSDRRRQWTLPVPNGPEGTTGGRSVNVSATVRWLFRRWADWDLLPNSSRAANLLKARRGEPAVPGIDWPMLAPHSRMTDQLQATIMVIHDLLVFTGSGGLVGKPLVPCLEVAAAETQLEIEHAGRRGTVSLPWPTPRWKTFWEFSLLRAAWNITWERADLQHGRHDEDLLRFRWLLACTTLLLGDPEQLTTCLLTTATGLPYTGESRPSNGDDKSDEKADWGALGRVLAALAREATSAGSGTVAPSLERCEMVKTWLWDVAMLMALELPSEKERAFDWAASLPAPPDSYWRNIKITARLDAAGQDARETEAQKHDDHRWKRAMTDALRHHVEARVGASFRWAAPVEPPAGGSS